MITAKNRKRISPGGSPGYTRSVGATRGDAPDTQTAKASSQSAPNGSLAKAFGQAECRRNPASKEVTMLEET